MILSKLKDCITEYKLHLKQNKLYEQRYRWEALKNFQAHWDIDHEEWYIMYDNALDSRLSRKLWNTHAWYPKKMMLNFIEHQTDFVKMMFKDLLNEDKAIQFRADRFVFYCDELFSSFKDKHQASAENSHFHSNFKMISLYLAFRYPDKYTLYEPEAFRNTMVKLGTKNIPQVNDLERFFKVNNTFYKFLEQDPELMEIHRERIAGEDFYQEKSLLICHDFYLFTGRKV